MTDVINVETVDRLQRVYNHVDDIDLFTGGLSERPVTGGVVGPTFACIIGQQFLNLRKGDRFWYENGNHPGAFTPTQLQEIRKSSLSRIICDGLDDIESLQPFAFLTVDGFNNQRRACKSTGIPRVNLRAWAEKPAGPQQLSSQVSLLPDFINELPPNAPEFGQLDLDFQQYLQEKSSAEKIALASKPGIKEVDETPTHLSRENYFHVFDNEPDPLLNEIGPQARSEVEQSRRLLEELFQSDQS